MTPVAKWNSSGNYGGLIVAFREITGDHRWLVRFLAILPPDETLAPDAEGYGKDQRVERDVVSKDEIPLDALGEFAQQSIADLFNKDGAIAAKTVSWTAYLQKPKRRKGR